MVGVKVRTAAVLASQRGGFDLEIEQRNVSLNTLLSCKILWQVAQLGGSKGSRGARPDPPTHLHIRPELDVIKLVRPPANAGSWPGARAKNKNGNIGL